MKRTRTGQLAMTLVVLLVAAGALAQGPPKWRGGGGWGQGGPYQHLYDPATVETVSGRVTRVEHVTPRGGMAPGVHLLLQTDKETIAVHLGPAWYIERQDTRLAAGDQIEVKGSRVTVQGKPALIAAEVHKGDQVLVLRDANGFPVWAGWRHRAP